MSDDERRALDESLQDYEDRAAAAQARAAQAYARLLHLAETRDSGQIRRIVQFLASTYNSTAFPWDPFDLRSLDVAISDDMLVCLDALRWGKADLHGLVSLSCGFEMERPATRVGGELFRPSLTG